MEQALQWAVQVSLRYKVNVITQSNSNLRLVTPALTVTENGVHKDETCRVSWQRRDEANLSWMLKERDDEEA